MNMFVFGDLGEWRDAADLPPGGRAYTTMERIENDWIEKDWEQTSDIAYDLLLHVGDVSCKGLYIHTSNATQRNVT